MDLKIARVIGNSLPFRDDKKLEAIRYVLVHDRTPSFVSQIWVLNQLRDNQETKELRALLEEHDQIMINIPFDVENYQATKTRKEKILAFIGINRARNFAIEACKPYDWLFLFDDTNYFNDDLWHITVQDLEQNIACHTPLAQQYAVPIIRHRGKLQKNYLDLPRNEPQLVFGSQSLARFDESYQFGNNDKVELLHRLGCQSQGTEYGPQTFCAKDNAQCPSIGSVLHVSFSDPKLELDLQPRMAARQRGIDRVIRELDMKYCC